MMQRAGYWLKLVRADGRRRWPSGLAVAGCGGRTATAGDAEGLMADDDSQADWFWQAVEAGMRQQVMPKAAGLMAGEGRCLARAGGGLMNKDRKVCWWLAPGERKGEPKAGWQECLPTQK